MNELKHILMAFVVGILLTNCVKSDPAKKQELIQKRIDKRVADFRKGLVNRCQKKIYEEAETRVDSMLIDYSRNINTIDTVQRPPKPIKPAKPVVPGIKDDTPVKPIF